MSEKKIAELKEDLSKQKELKNKYRNQRNDLQRQLDSVKPNLIAFQLMRGEYVTITHFVPESFGFKEIVKRDESGTTRIYCKDQFAMTQLPNNKWMMAKTVEEDGQEKVHRAEFEIHNKFVGYHVLKAFGVDVD